MKNIMIASGLMLLSACVNAMDAKKVRAPIVIDGIANEASWRSAQWLPLDQLLVGEMPTVEDFSGRFKVMWDNNQLYLLVELTDDVLMDSHPDPLDKYWDDDCLEIFIDEDNSGGNHQFNYNAFAYHIALDNQAVDIGKNHPDGSANFLTLNDHLDSHWRRSEQAPYNVIWEVALRVYDDRFDPTAKSPQRPVDLTVGKHLGFMLAYCDNDASKERESFMGSTPIKAINGDKNLGYITSDVFDKLTLIN